MRLVPPRITPPAKPLKGLAFLAAFVRNPLEVAPQAVYEQDLVANPVGPPAAPVDHRPGPGEGRAAR